MPTVLDDCNGHTHMVNGAMTYHYHFTDSYPWTIGKGVTRFTGLWRCTSDARAFARVL